MSGRPKLKIDKRYLNDFYYDTKYFQYAHHEFLFESELKLLEIISKNNFSKMNIQEFDKFVKENLKLIKQCRYIKYKKYKYEIKIQEIINKNNLNNEELHILELLEDHADITIPEYFYKCLDIYLSVHSQEIKAMQYQNITAENRVVDTEKQRNRKQQSHEKFYLGGMLNSLTTYLLPSQNKNLSEVLVEMIKIYIVLQVSNQANVAIGEFEKNQHLPVFNDVADKLALITQDPKNPFRKK